MSMIINPYVFSVANPMPAGDFIFYKFDEAASATSVENYTGGLDGTRNGTVTSVAGHIGTAWNFPGGSPGPYVNTNIQTPAGDVSLSLWVNMNSLTGRQMFYGDLASTGADPSARLCFGINGSNYEMLVGDGTSGYYNGTSFSHGLSTGVWTHLVYTLSGTSINIYKNGTLQHSPTSTVSKGGISIEAARVARGGGFNGLYLNAAVDNLRVYNRVLTAGEVTTLYGE